MTESGRPLLWARLSVRHTKKTFLPACAVPLLALILVVALRLFNLSQTGDNDFTIRGDLRSRLDDARTAARRDHKFDIDPAADTRLQSREGEQVVLLMRPTLSGSGKSARPASIDTDKRGKGNLLSREGIAFLKAAEDALYSATGYEKYCLREAEAVKDCDGKTVGCVLPDSITNHPNLYGRWQKERLCGRKAGSELVTVDSFNRFLWTLVKNDTAGNRIVNPQYAVFMGSDFDPRYGGTQVLRSFVQTGLPISNDTKVNFETWSKSVAGDLEDRSTSNFHMFLFGSYVDNFNSIIYRDLSLAGISVILVFLVMWVHTTSLLLAGVAILQILLSFPLTFFIYRAIFQIKYFAGTSALISVLDAVNCPPRHVLSLTSCVFLSAQPCKS